jgi:hypothetical protein
MNGKEHIGFGIVFVSWATILFVFNRPLSQAYREVWPNKFGSSNRDKGWHRVELLIAASLLLVFGIASLMGLI